MQASPVLAETEVDQKLARVDTRLHPVANQSRSTTQDNILWLRARKTVNLAISHEAGCILQMAPPITLANIWSTRLN